MALSSNKYYDSSGRKFVPVTRPKQSFAHWKTPRGVSELVRTAIRGKSVRGSKRYARAWKILGTIDVNRLVSIPGRCKSYFNAVVFPLVRISISPRGYGLLFEQDHNVATIRCSGVIFFTIIRVEPFQLECLKAPYRRAGPTSFVTRKNNPEAAL